MSRADPSRPLSDAQQDVLDTAALAELAGAKAWLLERGQHVTPRAVASAVLTARQRAAAAPKKEAEKVAERVERKAFKAELRREIDHLGQVAAGLVAAVVARTGTGPTWAELGAEMGWRRSWQPEAAVRKLVKAGWLSASDEPRSLRPGPKATKR
ncbi:MAG: hypothetical protein M0Z69_13495 [Actinomycetota bacterium]|nr:hypothetical protein [Actinomycetota bacterium]